MSYLYGSNDAHVMEVNDGSLLVTDVDISQVVGSGGNESYTNAVIFESKELKGYLHEGKVTLATDGGSITFTVDKSIVSEPSVTAHQTLTACCMASYTTMGCIKTT